MEHYKLNESRFADGVLHLIGEYRCKMCRSILIMDLGQVAPSSDEFPEIVETNLNIG